MQPTRKKRNRRRRGFTLLEVLLVVGIIALLAAFVVPSFIGTEKSAKIKLAKAMVDSGGTLATQLELYRMAMGKFPEELTGLTEKPDDDEEAEKWGGPYITDPNKLKDPWGNELQYKFPGEVNEGGYDLWSWGPDEEDGSDDDIKNWSSED
ncbi:MAG: type II secretion system major pseudopilin GspG [Planctomycetota bacterium]|jgi:general secretion pathway protein G